ncbi:hypothetical protein LINPERPRIM_LOCUS44470 [Linum perenne]
MGSGALVLV